MKGCSPTGGPLGHHYWGNILGRNFGSGFDISYLTDAEKTHTPDFCLNVTPYHEKTVRKWGGSQACSPCHRGSGHVRYNYSQPEYPWLAHAKAEAVECTFCHDIEGGYTPDAMWVDNAGNVINHNYSVSLPPDIPRDPYLAGQTCSSSDCHGHINDSQPGDVDSAKPDVERQG